MVPPPRLAMCRIATLVPLVRKPFGEKETSGVFSIFFLFFLGVTLNDARQVHAHNKLIHFI